MAQVSNGRYPDGSIIAIYGEYPDRNASAINPCGAGRDARNPSCMAVANALGVSYVQTAAERALVQAQQASPQPAEGEAPPTADPQAAPADTQFDDDEVTNEDLMAALENVQASTGQGGHQEQQKRHRTPDHGLRKRVPSAASYAVSAVSNSTAVSNSSADSNSSVVSNSPAPNLSALSASAIAPSGSFIRTSASAVNVSLSLPPIGFGIPPATTAAIGTITSRTGSQNNTNAALNGNSTSRPSKEKGTSSPPSITCLQKIRIQIQVLSSKDASAIRVPLLRRYLFSLLTSYMPPAVPTPK